MDKLLEKKNITKTKILNYILNHKTTSKAELAKQLNLSMPTVLSNVNDLVEKGLVAEVGAYESTGGRKAKTLGIQKNYCYAVGVDITANHVGLVLVNLAGEVVKQKRIKLKFQPDVGYCGQLSEIVQTFFQDKAECAPESKSVAGKKNMSENEAKTENTKHILGIGISLPGIINKHDKILMRSHALGLENYSLKMIEQMMPLPVYFENDANAAMLAEDPKKYSNAVYLSLNNTLGGAVCVNGQLFSGQNHRAGEFGHMVLEPKGRRCYCGKQGCADAYCAASVLTQNGRESLDRFMEKLENQDSETAKIWDLYLEYLAVLISNLRMAYDTDIILGGDVGGYLPKYMMELGKRIFKYNIFDGDLSYLTNCSYKKEASAVGVAKYFFDIFVRQV